MIHPICARCDCYPCICGRDAYVSRPELCEPVGGVESGWLIESTHPVGPPQWLAAVMGMGRWTGDASKAVRFCRKQDADWIIDSMWQHGLAKRGFAVATEHQWG